MKIFKILLAGFCAVFTGFGFMSCSSKKSLVGNWTVSEFTVNGESKAVIPANIAIDSFEGEYADVYGCSGVNSLSGKVHMAEGKIYSPVEFACTKMMGSPEEQEFEDLFLQVISYADSYDFENDTLTIKSSSQNGTIKFNRSAN